MPYSYFVMAYLVSSIGSFTILSKFHGDNFDMEWVQEPKQTM
jgi:hypothetical protein